MEYKTVSTNRDHDLVKVLTAQSRDGWKWTKIMDDPTHRFPVVLFERPAAAP